MELHYFEISTLPRLYEIVWCLFPIGDDGRPGPKLRPGLVRRTLMDPDTRRGAVEVRYGTTKLKLDTRSKRDLIIQNSTSMGLLGLPIATRFDLDHSNVLPWCSEYFCPPPHAATIVTGRLTEEYIERLRTRVARMKKKAAAVAPG